MTLSKGDKEVALSLTEHLAQLEQSIIQYQAILLVLDPMLAFTGKRADTHKTADVRGILAPLGAMAERTGCTILAVFHLNKDSKESNSIYRFVASLDFAAAARSVLAVGKNPDDPNQRVLASVKSNLSATSASLGFHISEDGEFVWGGVVELDAATILAVPTVEETGAREDAKSFLADILKDGEVPAKEVLAEARQCGIAEKTLRRAATDLKVDIAHIGERGKKGGGYWVWGHYLSKMPK